MLILPALPPISWLEVRRLQRWSRRGGTVDPKVLEALAAIAPDASFERVSDWRWVAPSVDGIRPMVEVKAFKGATRSAAWGVAIDFVPVMGEAKLSWKRSAEKARLDLHLGPRPSTGTPLPDWCTFRDRDGPARAARIARKVRKLAAEELAPVTSIEAIVAIFETRGPPIGSPPRSGYTQRDLAWGLCLDALGREAEASMLLARFCQLVELDPGDRILAKARELARAYGAAEKESAPEPEPRGA